MALMMTGRVLLVCALCVLWCGAGGGRCDEEGVGVGAGVSGGGVEPPPESKGLETSSQTKQDIKVGAVGAKENLPLSPTKEDDEDVDEETEDKEEKRAEGQSSDEGTVALAADPREGKLIGSERQTDLSIISTGSISPSGSEESNAIPTQTEVAEKDNSDESPPAVESVLTTDNGENTMPAGIAEGTPPPPPKDGVGSHKRDGGDTTSEDKKDVPSPETAATPQIHRDKGLEETGEERKATTVPANTTDTTNTWNNDSSTAVFHTISSLLILVVVACAAVAAVVAA
ncbi:mucin-associated surface protein (MASP), putative [Trypanosoma cruzi marinkellei]|uniref:Mucin-associated surface protein (MASP), putative n=1 Tax=Trypanosoma cruzi marinkellei TaxID=85056 RepID=K2MUG8_TRYCR|nr:mucin-associated surface protein (MASP), putative [Trypanosoma cruzi marinkellei]